MSQRSLNVELGERSYPIRIGAGLLGRADAYAALRGRPCLLLTDSNVAAHHLGTLRRVLPIADERILVLPPGESRKSWDQAGEVLDWMLGARLARDGVLIVLGGGVMGDLGGFCAALYQRGIDFLQLPTTLLAQVDSSVGGKTAVNHPRGKNLIGAFHQPVAVIVDTDTLKTLPPRELSAGLAEVIKYGLLADRDLFDWLEQRIDALLAVDPTVVAEAVERCCAIKARIVGLDEKESLSGGPRSLLNLGHTFGHAIETFAGYGNWLHGEAVGAGMCMAGELSRRLGWISDEDQQRLSRLIARAGLPTEPPAGMTPDGFRQLMGLDKKIKDGKLRLILLRELGSAVLSADFDDAQLQATLEHFCGAPRSPGTQAAVRRGTGPVGS